MLGQTLPVSWDVRELGCHSLSRVHGLPIGLGVLALQYVVDLIELVTGREPPFGMPPDAEGPAFEETRTT